jgi:DNA-binding protein HU-beta
MDWNLAIGAKMRTKSKRTTLRARNGTKEYVVRDSKGRFEDVQSYKRAHGMDVKRRSKAERKKGSA